jgi:2-(1,2-epoxy-1,2-dihydrophenyl)acetyl-CoA isomerase
MSLRTDERGAVRVLTLDRPEALNALTIELLDELLVAIGEAEAAGAPIVLTGAGRGFCAGADLTAFDGIDAGRTLGETVADRMRTHFNEVSRRFATADVPVVVAVNGVAAGGGVGLALCGDVTLAGESAQFVNVFAQQLGLVPDMGASWFVPRAIGRARAQAWALLGTPVDARTALDWGMAWSVHRDEDLIDDALATARRLGTLPTATLHAVRRTVESSTVGLLPALNTEGELQADLIDRGHLIEGVRAFVAGEEPDFSAFRRR